MLVLGLDTSTQVCALGIVDLDRGVTLAVSAAPVGPRQGERLLANLDCLLIEAGLGFCDLGAFAVSIGPGSFTGLRVGMATTKGLAFALGLPVAGVPTLEALAEAALALPGPDLEAGTLLWPCLDARRGEVHSQPFEIVVEATSRPRLRPLREVSCGTPEDLIAELMSSSTRRNLLIGDGPGRYPALADVGARVLSLVHCPPDGAVVARLGARQLAADRAACSPGALAVLYVQTTDAERGRQEGRLGGRTPFGGSGRPRVGATTG